jgi:hypothetical protein
MNEILAAVRTRLRRLALLAAAWRTLALATAVMTVAFVLVGVFPESPRVVAAAGVLTFALLIAIVVQAFRPAFRRRSDLQIARLVEEHHPELEDRLVTAVGLADQSQSQRPGLADQLLADAARVSSSVEPRHVVPDDRLRRAGLLSAAGVLALAVVLVLGRDRGQQMVDAVGFVLFPSHLTLEVIPGSVRVAAGAPLTIEARIAGSRAPVALRLLRSTPSNGGAEERREWEPLEMASNGSGAFQLRLNAVPSSFSYRVEAGTLASAVYDVTVARPPRVTRIDVDYRFPAALGMKPETEVDGGDIYAPAGTEVRLRIHTDREATGALRMGDGASVDLTTVDAPAAGETDPILTAGLTVSGDNSYRVALVDRDGFSSAGDTEYFIRPLDDRPPEVHIKKPARDRSVSMLEEVEIEADAEDDFALDRLDLVYAVRGERERVVPLAIPPSAAAATVRHTLYLEDLGVQPGDFVSYYVRARDRARGKKPSESRSDIFFLEVKPFEQEFVMAQSQAAGSGSRSLDDLVAAQKEVIVATWKLDRRTGAAGAKSADDIRTVAHTEDELKTRVEETSSAFRETNLRDPRSRPQPGRGQPPGQPAGQSRPEEDAMTLAARAMGTAVSALTRLQTGPAIPAEMDALNHLLKAQSDVRRQQISRQSGSGGGNRQSQDMSSLFDRELRRAQETNYETPSSGSQNNNDSLADKVKELAKRQDELNQRQQQAARMTAEEQKRELEKLSRDQNQLRRDADDLARQMEQQGGQSQSGQGAQGRQSQPGQDARSSGQNQSGGQQSRNLRAASEEMRNAANGLDRQDPRQAAARGAQASERLRAVERQLRSNSPDEQRRALGDMQLEARQLGDAEQKMADALRSAPTRDDLRRLAGEQERLADRADRLQGQLDSQASGLAAASDADRDLQRAVAAARNDANRLRLDDRLRQNAEAIRRAAEQSDDRKAATQAATSIQAQEAAARDLRNLADQLAAARTPGDDASRKLAEDRRRVQELRDDLDRLGQEIERLAQQSNGRAGTPSSQNPDPGRSGRGQSGVGGTGADLAALQEQYNRRLQETRQLLDQLQREDPTFSRGGPGLTFEGRGMTLSSPGTEAFKQDFAKWEELRRQANTALDRAESSLSQRLQAKTAADRLPAGAADRPPADYQNQVDQYFKSLAVDRQR